MSIKNKLKTGLITTGLAALVSTAVLANDLTKKEIEKLPIPVQGANCQVEIRAEQDYFKILGIKTGTLETKKVRISKDKHGIFYFGRVFPGRDPEISQQICNEVDENTNGILEEEETDKWLKAYELNL